MTSNIEATEAQEWLESLQQIGEGWYRQVMLAVKMGAHKALGLERREFAAQVGQRMIDPTEAILDLYRDNRNLTAIADVLGISKHTVSNVLIEARLIEGVVDVMHGYVPVADRAALPSAQVIGSDGPADAQVIGSDGTADAQVETKEQLDSMRAALKEAEDERKRQAAKFKKAQEKQQRETEELQRILRATRDALEAATSTDAPDEPEAERTARNEAIADEREAETAALRRRMKGGEFLAAVTGELARLDNFVTAWSRRDFALVEAEGAALTTTTTAMHRAVDQVASLHEGHSDIDSAFRALMRDEENR